MTQAGDVSSKGAGSQGGTQGAQSSQQGQPQGGVVDQAKDTVQQFAGQAKEQVTQRAQSTFDQGKERAAEQLTGVAQTLRQTTDQLKSGGQLAFAAPYLDRGVSQLERLADYVRTADVQDLAQQAERFSRQQPALFLGLLFGAGIAGARFLKSSQRDVQTQGAGSGRYPNYGGSAYGSGSSYGAGNTAGAGYGGSSTSGGSYDSGVGGGTGASSAGGFYTGSTAGSQGSSTGSLSSTGGYGSGSYGDASGSSASGASSADDARGMDIGPTSSGLRGDI